jgi:surface antigen
MSCFASHLPAWKTGSLLLIMLFVTGCARDQQQAAINGSQESLQEGICQNTPEDTSQAALLTPDQDTPDDTDLSLESGLKSPPLQQRSTKECYSLQPTCTQKTKKKGGRCEPQSLPFARCRSGIKSCGLGWNNGPLTWFACEKKQGNTSSVPRAGSVLILDAVTRHKMPTGHVAYVEKVFAEDDAHYQIVFSHTNYDRQCSLETNIKASYNSSTKNLDIYSGAWKDWGKRLPVAGFILR